MAISHSKRLLRDVVRFEKSTTKTESCWLWTGTISDGYGQFYVNGRRVRAHRYSYEQRRGPIPAGLQLDHLCRVRHCVNPDHLEVVTNRVNVLRGDGITARQARQTMCRNGHPLAGDNLAVCSRGKRTCLTCRRLHGREYMRQVRLRQKTA